MDFLRIPGELLSQLDVGWTFLLLSARFTGLFILLPGIGEGLHGLVVRAPAIIILSFTCLATSQTAAIPETVPLLAAHAAVEFSLGMAIAMIPHLIIAGIKLAGLMASTTMGLGAAQLLDPNLGVSVSDVARVFGDLCTVFFLLIGGHHAVIYAAAGMGGELAPGAFLMSDVSVTLLVNASAEVFKIGAMVSAPVVVALLLTQFVMGLITKAVPTVNIFIISFPLTIGIGLILSLLSLPEILVYVDREFSRMDDKITVVIADSTSTAGAAQDASAPAPVGTDTN